MTIRERVERFLSRAAPDKADLLPLLEEAIREELRDAASTLDAAAAHKETMYRDLGMHGEDQARPYREIAAGIRRRSEI
jgi:hypothetical protein